MHVAECNHEKNATMQNENHAWLQNATVKRVNINSRWSAFNCFINRIKSVFYFKIILDIVFYVKNIHHQKISIITYECWERKALIPIVEQIRSIHSYAQGLIFIYTSSGLGSWLSSDQRREKYSGSESKAFCYEEERQNKSWGKRNWKINDNLWPGGIR